MVSRGPEICAGVGSFGAKRRKKDSAGRVFSWIYMRRNTGESFVPLIQKGWRIAGERQYQTRQGDDGA
jgi:uncharacterized protein affecting Mg2+/Co2+ transport